MADTNKDENKALNEKEILTDAFKKVTDSELYKEMPKLIGICASLIAITAVLLKGMFYFFEWGYFKAYNIDASYIDMNRGSLMYSIIGYSCLAVIFLLSNYSAYQMLVKKRYIKLVRFLLGEVLCFYILLLIFNNISPIDALANIVSTYKISRFFIDAFEITIMILIMNALGISSVWVPLHVLKFVNSKSKNTASKSKNTIISSIVFWLLSVLLAAIVIFFLAGLHQGNNRKDFKIINEKVDEDVLSNNRIFKIEGSDEYLSFYAVLYENTEIYIVSPIIKMENTLYINRNDQKVIGKENVETKHIKDIADIKDIYKLDLNEIQVEGLAGDLLN